MSASGWPPPLALLAGGLAKRLRPLTDTSPKAMIEVAGQPFIAHQLRQLATEGIERVVICAGYLAEQIAEFVDDGSRWGLKVTYSLDGETLLGTGGALRKALPLLGETFFTMYGDSYLDIAFAPIFRAFTASGCLGLMTVFRNEGRWDSSNVEFADGGIKLYDKVNRTPVMRYIDYGLGVLSASAVALFPANVPLDLARLYQDLLARKQLAGFEVYTRFYEIGSPEGLSETERYFKSKAAAREALGRAGPGL